MATKKFKTREEAEMFVSRLTLMAAHELLVELLLNQQEEAPKIPITEEQFNQHFRLIGITADGKVQRRGRPKKEKEPELL